MAALPKAADRQSFEIDVEQILVRDRDTDEEKIIWQADFEGVEWAVRADTLAELGEEIRKAFDADDVDASDFGN